VNVLKCIVVVSEDYKLFLHLYVVRCLVFCRVGMALPRATGGSYDLHGEPKGLQ
jgi:hypothetical protein